VSSEVHACAFLVATTCEQLGGAPPGTCAQHAVSAVQGSESVAAGGAPIVGLAAGVAAACVGHCAAQLWRMQAPTAIPGCMHEGDIMLGAHSAMALPSQMHLVKSGHAAPTAVICERQLVATQLLHASVTFASMWRMQVATSVVDMVAVAGAVAVVGGGAATWGAGWGALVGATETWALAVTGGGEAGGGGGSDPHAVARLTTAMVKNETRWLMGPSGRS